MRVYPRFFFLAQHNKVIVLDIIQVKVEMNNKNLIAIFVVIERN